LRKIGNVAEKWKLDNHIGSPETRDVKKACNINLPQRRKIVVDVCHNLAISPSNFLENLEINFILAGVFSQVVTSVKWI